MNKSSFKERFCAKEGDIKKSHSRGFLSGISATFKGKRGGDPRLRPSGMTFNLMGFTLIELLVVVLIIGILAAVALPQYNKAVDKSKVYAELPKLKAVADAVQRCLLEKGNYTTCANMDDLDIEVDTTCTPIAKTSSCKIETVNVGVGNNVYARLWYQLPMGAVMFTYKIDLDNLNVPLQCEVSGVVSEPASTVCPKYGFKLVDGNYIL